MRAVNFSKSGKLLAGKTGVERMPDDILLDKKVHVGRKLQIKGQAGRGPLRLQELLKH